MSLTPIFFIVAAATVVMAIGLWIFKDTAPAKTDKVKNVLSLFIIILFMISAGSLASAIASVNANQQKSKQECHDVYNGYVVSINDYDYCFEEPPKLIGKI